MKLYSVSGIVTIELDFSKPEIKAAWDGHMNFVESGIGEGWLLCTGPKTAGGGGVMIIRAENMDALNKIFEKDPLHAIGGNRFEIIEFDIQSVQPCMEQWINS